MSKPASQLKNLRQDIDKCVRVFNDFPKPGFIFHDIMPLFRQPQLVSSICSEVAELVRGKVDAVASLDAKGFLLGPQIAMVLEVPFVPIRKKGKLPGRVIVSNNYTKAHGVDQDVCEIQADAIQCGQRFLFFDDVLASGGTMRAAIDLIHKALGIVTQAIVLIELESYCGSATIPKHVEFCSLAKYDI
uniref:adenine phosphoribosyltransferase n=1 Tax=Ditylenchus dipsaci TaxID=166011 RepID=A0A915DHK1_9BILA